MALSEREQRRRWRLAQERYRKKKRAANLCIWGSCSKKAGEGHTYCKDHRTREGRMT